jgi:CHAD domain-containing protein
VITELLAELGERAAAADGDPPQEHVRVALHTRLRVLLKHDPGTRSGVDPEDLHQMRVAVRRMRAVLRAARPLLDQGWADGLRAELGWLGRALGPVRDLDVLLERLHGEAAALGEPDAAAAGRLLAALEEERAEARSAMLDALDSGRYRALLRRVLAAATSPVPASAAPGRRPALEELVTREFRRLRAGVRAAGDDPPDAVLHALRIQGKRLRYTAELVEPVLGTPVRELLRATIAMQDVLGDHQDACVARQRVRDLLHDLGPDAGPAVAFAAGRLFEREEVRRQETRGAWPPAWRAVRSAAKPLTRSAERGACG